MRRQRWINAIFVFIMLFITVSSILSSKLYVDHIIKQCEAERDMKPVPLVINHIDQSELAKFNSLTLNVKPVLQKPEFPTGCEYVSLTALINYLTGDELDKSYLIDNYMINSNDAASGYVGDPRSPSGAGCFQNTLIQVTNNYFNDREEKTNLKPYDISGSNLKEIYDNLNKENPVIIWTTIDYINPPIDKSDYDVGDYEFYTKEHCVVLIGYDLNNYTFKIMDPLQGIIDKDIDLVYDIYNKVGKYAMIIK